MDLLGAGPDGGLYLWQANTQVQPLSRFSRSGGHVKSAHYVIEHRGKAVTVHVSNLAAGGVTVQFMCGGEVLRFGSHKTVEEKLLGIVLRDPVAEREILEKLQELHANLQARHTAEHLRRGSL